MYRIIVCDDNVAYKDTLVMMLKKYTDLYDAEIIGFSNGRKMLEYCSKNGFDIIYLDIELGEDNGMDYAKTIKKMNPKALIIYIYRHMIITMWIWYKQNHLDSFKKILQI